jgi:hypothetical protein
MRVKLVCRRQSGPHACNSEFVVHRSLVQRPGVTSPCFGSCHSGQEEKLINHDAEELTKVSQGFAGTTAKSDRPQQKNFSG